MARPNPDSAPVLGIETSCDETGVAVYQPGHGLLAQALYSQIELHRAYGGVVPELASRDHIRKLAPLVNRVLGEAQVRGHDLAGVAYTAGPGLIGALLTGAALATGLAVGWGVPRIGVHHMEGHLLAPLLESDPPDFPFLALLVSGGHTQLVDVAGPGRYRLLGDTLDDAVGEAFDKTAKLLGLEYPGGPALARLAREGGPADYAFPRPMTRRPGLDFSFSGLKTAVVHALKGRQPDRRETADVAWAFQEAAVDTLVIKSQRGLRATGYRRMVVAGGVGANRRLRERLGEGVAEMGATVHYPRPEFCTDNGAMIAHVGAWRCAEGVHFPTDIPARARWSLETLRPPRL